MQKKKLTLKRNSQSRGRRRKPKLSLYIRHTDYRQLSVLIPKDSFALSVIFVYHKKGSKLYH